MRGTLHLKVWFFIRFAPIIKLPLSWGFISNLEPDFPAFHALRPVCRRIIYQRAHAREVVGRQGPHKELIDLLQPADRRAEVFCAT